MAYANQLITIGTYSLDDRWITSYKASADKIQLSKWTDLDGIEQTEYSPKKRLNVSLSLCDMPESVFSAIRNGIGDGNVKSVTAYVGSLGRYVTQDCEISDIAAPVTYTKDKVVYGSMALTLKGKGGTV